MIALSNDQLEVTVLDPVSDRDRFGTRYCTGGYIFQITDHRVGDLLTGPTYPDSFNVYDGQGIPDAFNRAPLRDPLDPNRGLILGVGMCDLRDNRVIEFCDWAVEASEQQIRFRAEQSLADFSLTIVREISLEQRTVRSKTHVRNTGAIGFPICWYPHPFFPQPESDELCRLSIPFRIADNPGYDLASSGFIQRRDWPWKTDYYLALDHDAHAPLSVIQRHPKLGLIGGTFSYVPRFFPIWGNPNTFSWEPYFEQTVAAGQSVEWSMAYDF
ncbi:hypothetical protein ACFLRO_01140 [Bacteroidota bacterium]